MDLKKTIFYQFDSQCCTVNNMKNVSISNVKMSAKIPEVDLKEIQWFCKKNKIKTRIFNRGHLVVYDNSTFTFFKKGPNLYQDQHCNITKVNHSKIQNAIEDLAWLINKKPNQIFYTVDNITASADLGRRLSLREFIAENEDLEDYIQYTPERFPGLFVRGKKGKAILFKSGKIVVIGVKSEKELQELLEWIELKCANI